MAAVGIWVRRVCTLLRCVGRSVGGVDAGGCARHKCEGRHAGHNSRGGRDPRVSDSWGRGCHVLVCCAYVLCLCAGLVCCSCVLCLCAVFVLLCLCSCAVLVCFAYVLCLCAVLVLLCRGVRGITNRAQRGLAGISVRWPAVSGIGMAAAAAVDVAGIRISLRVIHQEQLQQKMRCMCTCVLLQYLCYC